MTNAATAAEQNWHLQASAAHILHLGNLIDDLAESVVDEIDEHEVDHRPRPCHPRATRQTEEAAFANWGVAQSLGTKLGIQAMRCHEITATRADPFPP